MNQTVGGKINCNCNGGHVGQESVRVGVHHLRWANVARPQRHSDREELYIYICTTFANANWMVSGHVLDQAFILRLRNRWQHEFGMSAHTQVGIRY